MESGFYKKMFVLFLIIRLVSFSFQLLQNIGLVANELTNSKDSFEDSLIQIGTNSRTE